MKTKERALLFIYVVDFPQDGKPACGNYHKWWDGVSLIFQKCVGTE